MIDVLYVLACGVVFAAGLYRLHRMDAASTRLSVRVSFWAMSVGAFTCLMASAVWGYVPDWPDVLLAWVFALIQVRTATIWRDGVPGPYLR